MADAKREISGFFVSTEKFLSHLAALSRPDCITTHLRLFHNESHHTAAVVDALSRNTSVTNLDIFELDPVAANALATVLSESRSLISLTVHHPQGNEATQNLCRGIALSRTLTSLHLSQLDADGVAALATALLAWSPGPTHSNVRDITKAPAAATSDCISRLHHLRLEKCTFTPDAAASLAEALVRQAGALVQLEVVDSELGDAAAEALLAAKVWSQVLDTTAVLSSLDLSSCHIGPRGAAQLGHFLALSGRLHTLKLANNKAIACEGARAISACLAKNRGLLRLDMSACGISTNGIETLGNALRPRDVLEEGDDDGLPPLQQLTLSFNAAGARGLAALLVAMSGPRPCRLRNLQLDHNHIRGVEMTEALLSCAAKSDFGMLLQRNGHQQQPPTLPRVTASLEQLALAGNALYDAGVAVLGACLSEAPCLEHLDLRENGISDVGVAALLPLINPCGGRGGSGGGCAQPVTADSRVGAPAATNGSLKGLQGLLLDGNRLHNAGAQALLAAVAESPGLWRFSVEANKLTDPALRMSLAMLSQKRAARHSQLAVLGRYYSSSSSSSDDDGSGSGRGAEGSDWPRGCVAADCGPHGTIGASLPMDVDMAAVATMASGAAPGGAAAEGCTQHHKHRLEERDALVEGSEAGSGDEVRPLRNVAARGADGAALPAGGGSGGGGGGAAISVFATSSRSPQEGRLPPMGTWCSLACGDDRAIVTTCADPWAAAVTIPGSLDRCSVGGSSIDSASSGDTMMLGCLGHAGGAASSAASLPVRCTVPFTAAGAAGGGDGGGGATFCTSPPPAMCFVTAITGVGGANSVGVSKQASTGCGSGHPTLASVVRVPQQLLPACRRPLYKPLTPEQQRLFEDF